MCGYHYNAIWIIPPPLLQSTIPSVIIGNVIAAVAVVATRNRNRVLLRFFSGKKLPTVIVQFYVWLDRIRMSESLFRSNQKKNKLRSVVARTPRFCGRCFSMHIYREKNSNSAAFAAYLEYLLCFLPSFILVDFVVVGVFFSQLFLFLLLLLPRNCSVVYFRSEFVSFVIPWNGMANVHNSGRPQRECCHWEGLRPPTPAHLHTSSAGNSSQKLWRAIVEFSGKKNRGFRTLLRNFGILAFGHFADVGPSVSATVTL